MGSDRRPRHNGLRTWPGPLSGEQVAGCTGLYRKRSFVMESAGVATVKPREVVTGFARIVVTTEGLRSDDGSGCVT